MRGRLNSEASYKITLIKYVRTVTGCGLREAKEFVEGTYALENLTHDQHRKLGEMFGWNYQYQNSEWVGYNG